MTRNRTYGLTAIAAGLYIALSTIFADGMFTGTFWNSEAIASSTIVTYLLLAAIIGAGIYQASRIPASGIALSPVTDSSAGQVDDPRSWKLLMGNAYYALLWMPIRFFVGQEWLAAGEHKLRDDGWMKGGAALKGYWTNAAAVPEQGRPAITYAWFRDFLNFLLRHESYTWFGKVIAIGETLVGLGLIFGALVGIAAFFGTLMNFNFQLAGSASTNPVLFGLGVFLVLGWKTAGFFGLDRVLLPALKTPWARIHLGRDHTLPAAPTGQVRLA